jgi:hypothetical protein
VSVQGHLESQSLYLRIILWHMGRFYNRRMSVNILAATNTGNNRRTAVSMRRPVNKFPLKNVTTIGSLLLWDMRCDWLLGYATILNGRGFLCGLCHGYVMGAVSCRTGVNSN